MVENLLFVVSRAEQNLSFLGGYTISFTIVAQEAQGLESFDR